MTALWNLMVCLIVSVVCWSFLLGRHAENRLAIVTNAGLLLLAVGMFASAFAPFVRGESPTWWALLARTGAACVGGVMYEQRFGVRAQAFALAMHFIRWPARLRAAIARIRSGVHLVRQ
jgi:hypothetical protein